MYIQKKENVSGSVLKGILLMISSMTIVPIMDGLAKFLSSDYPIAEVVWGRYIFHFFYLFPIVLFKYGPSALLPRHLALQIIRGGLLVCSTFFFFAAIAEMPLADTLALVFISPIIVTTLSSVLLGEVVGVRRWSAVSFGFLGALVIIRPGFNNIEIGTIFALTAGTIYAFYIIATRKLSGSAPPLITLTFTALLGAVIMSVLVPFQWIEPSKIDWLLMAAMGACAALGHFLLIKAFDNAKASVLAPFSYFEIIVATIIGFVIFDDFPDTITWLGIGIIILSGVYISVRERKVGEKSLEMEAKESNSKDLSNRVTRNANR